MARIRSVHPGQWTDAEFLQCSPLARLLALALRNEADDQGVFIWKPVDIKIRLLPLDTVDVPALLTELQAHNQVRMYEIGGRKLGAIRNFNRYQSPRFPKAIHPITDDIRKYTTPTEPITVIDGVEDDAIQRNAEKKPERERRGVHEGEKISSLRSDSGSPRKTRQAAAHLPAEWKPDEKQRAYAAKLGLDDADIGTEVVKFVYYFVEGQGSGERRTDRGWRQSWARWTGNAAKTLPPKPRTNGHAEPPLDTHGLSPDEHRAYIADVEAWDAPSGAPSPVREWYRGKSGARDPRFAGGRAA